ncbi:MAG: hypothetical protein BWY72_01130 [Bacteroidetes bacterium ADurb.Bin416]|nr:MAG: hypothetical protein BWY72_01130 [Bacteroidetes bacterium ADurb.Bin416]
MVLPVNTWPAVVVLSNRPMTGALTPCAPLADPPETKLVSVLFCRVLVPAPMYMPTSLEALVVSKVLFKRLAMVLPLIRLTPVPKE